MLTYYGWLAPDGKHYPLMADETHSSLAEKCAAIYYPDEWLHEPKTFASEISFLWQRGWISIDTRGIYIAGWIDPTPEQFEVLRKLPDWLPLDDQDILKKVIELRENSK